MDNSDQIKLEKNQSKKTFILFSGCSVHEPLTNEIVDGEVQEVGDEDPVHDVGAEQHEQREHVRQRLRAAPQQPPAQRRDLAAVAACARVEWKSNMYNSRVVCL